jgi:hypothetical protein
MVLGAGIFFQVDLVLILVGIESLIIHTISDAEPLDPGRVTVGNQGVSGGLFVLGRSQFFGFIRAYGDDLVTQLDKLSLDFLQLSQLRVAVRSPASAIEDENNGLFRRLIPQIETASVEILETDIGDLGAN